MSSHPHQTKTTSRKLLLAACSRPNLLLPAWLSAATGAALSGGTFPSTIPLIIVALGFSFILGAIHAANLIADRHSDQNNGKNTFWMDQLPATIIARHATGWVIIGLLLSAWAHWRFLLPVGATLVLGYCYSLPPLRLSARWGWDLLANIVGYCILAPWWGSMITHWEPSSTAPQLVIPWAAAAFLAPIVTLAFALSTILDVNGDRISGKNTLAVRFKLESGRFRPLLVAGVFAGVLAAGIPGLQAYPQLGVFFGVWIVLAYGLTFLVHRKQDPSP